MKPVYRRTVLSSFASLALAACGGSEGAPPAPTPPAPTPTPTPTPSPAPSPTPSPPPVPAPAAPTVIDEGANRLIVSVLQEGVLRLRVGPNRVFENDQGPQLMVVKPDSAWPGAVNQDGRPDVIKTAAFELTIRRNPVSVTLRDRQGKTLIDNWIVDFTKPNASWLLAANEHIYGFGDQRTDIDKRGQTLELWNTDTDFHAGNLGAAYKSVPMYWSSAGYGVFLNNARKSIWKFDGSSARTSISVDGGEFDLYVFVAPNAKELIGRYTELTGRPALLPKWFFGYHQGGAGNPSEGSYATGIGDAMRALSLPIDVVYYDSWDDATFTKSFVSSVWDVQRLRISAGLGLPFSTADDALWRKLDAMSPKGHVVDGDNKTLRYTGYGMGSSVTEIDYFSPAVADLVFNETWKKPIESGVFAGMLDFGELNFVPNPDRAFFPSFSTPRRSVTELHNLFGLAYTEGLVERASKLTGLRKIGMSRPGTAGSQRFGWTWTADSTPKWSEDGIGGLREHIKAVLNLSNSGFSNVGYDIGGWSGVASTPLFLRWFQAGMFNPYASAHGEGDHTLYKTHKEQVDQFRQALERRYRLLPYLYSLHHEAHITGVPMIRSLALETNVEAGTENIGDQWFVGPWMLVAPIVSGATAQVSDTARDIYLPSGNWLEYGDSKTVHTGPKRLVKYPAGMGEVPVFIRAGAIIPMQPVVQYTDQPLPANYPLTLYIYPSSVETNHTLFEDDGVRGYENGNYALTRFSAQQTGGSVKIKIAAREVRGTFKPAARQYLVKVHAQSIVNGLSRNGSSLPQLSMSELAAGALGWSFDPEARSLSVRLQDDGSEQVLSSQ